MKNVKMKTPTGQIMSRIPQKDIPYHVKNGWELIGEKQGKPEKKKSVKLEEVQADLTLDLNEENE